MIETRDIKAAATAQKEDLASPRLSAANSLGRRVSRNPRQVPCTILALHSQTVHWKKSKVQVTANEKGNWSLLSHLSTDITSSMKTKIVTHALSINTE